MCALALCDDPMVTFFSQDVAIIGALRDAFRAGEVIVSRVSVAPCGDRVISAMAMACVLARTVCLTEPQSRVYTALEARARAMLCCNGAAAAECTYASVRRAKLRERLPRLHRIVFPRRSKLRRIRTSEIFVRIEQTGSACAK